MGLGAIVAAVVTAAMTVRYDASATVALPERLDANQLLGAANQTSFTGSDGQSLEVVDQVGAIRFIGSSDNAEVAARTANAAATAFVAGVDEDGVRLATAASAPSDPAWPRRMFNLVIGTSIGAVAGLILQAALRPPMVDESVTFVPTWTTLEDIPEETLETAEPEPIWAADALATEQPEAEILMHDDTSGDDELTGPSSGDDELTGPSSVDAASHDVVDGPPVPDIPDPPVTPSRGFRDLVNGTSPNPDPMIDRFAGDDEAIDDHEAELEGLQSDVELDTALAASADELERAQRTSAAVENRRTAANEDLVAEIEFLRIEIERYQRSLDEERVTHSTAIASARLENEDALDLIQREHRVTLNQLAQTNRNLLSAQRNEAEAIMAELESDHQRALDDAHKDYEQRLADARTHHADQLASLEERAVADLKAEHSAKLDELQQRLDVALLDTHTAQQQTAQLEAEIASSDRRVEQAKLLHSQTERRLREEHRQMERRNDDLTELLARTEERLAHERRRTNEVVRNLLRESATTASDADWARRSDIEFRDEVGAEQAKEIDQLNERLRSLEDTTARREATLEATIAELRHRLGASPNG
jgi:hypothetical protein